MTHKSDVQRLIDICFQLVDLAHQTAHMTGEQRMAWAANQLRLCGFPTVPVGSSWGVLEDDVERAWPDDERMVSYYGPGPCGDVWYSGVGVRENRNSPHFWVMHEGKPEMIRFATASALPTNCGVPELARLTGELDELRQAVRKLTP